jgi:hypothetical protein
MAFDYGARMKAGETGTSNAIEDRAGEMSRWMARAARPAVPAPDVRFRLAFS